MVWKSIIFTFCLIKSSAHDQSECTNIFHSYLKKVLDQYETFKSIWPFTYCFKIRIIILSGQHRNKYCLREYGCWQKQHCNILRSFQTVLEAFLQLWEVTVHGFSGISKDLHKKNSVMESRFINVAKRHV